MCHTNFHANEDAGLLSRTWLFRQVFHNRLYSSAHYPPDQPMADLGRELLPQRSYPGRLDNLSRMDHTHMEDHNAKCLDDAEGPVVEWHWRGQ